RKLEEWRARCPLPIVSLDAFVCTLTGELERDEYVSWSLARGTVTLARAAAADLLHCKHFAHLTTSTRKKPPAIRKRRVGGEVCGEPNGVSRVVMGEDQRGALPMLKAAMLLAGAGGVRGLERRRPPPPSSRLLRLRRAYPIWLRRLEACPRGPRSRQRSATNSRSKFAAKSRPRSPARPRPRFTAKPRAGTGTTERPRTCARSK